jgi:hypothetical protein
MLTEQIEDIEERIANSYEHADPKGIVASAPGTGPVLAAAITGRLGDASRFRNLAAVRAYSGMIPKMSLSGVGGGQHGLTKAGDPYLREALFMAADQARRADPQLGRPVPTSDRSRQAPQHGALHPVHGPAHTYRCLLAHWDALPTERSRPAPISTSPPAEYAPQRSPPTSPRSAKPPAKPAPARPSKAGRAGRSKESQSAPSTGPPPAKLPPRTFDIR